jgi:hypothetical protein
VGLTGPKELQPPWPKPTHIAQEVVKRGFAGWPQGMAGHENRGDAPIVVGLNRLTAQQANGLEPIMRLPESR